MAEKRGMHGVCFLFDTGKIEDSYYGLVAWKVFWKHVSPMDLGRRAVLLSGDTININPRDYGIAVLSEDESIIDKVKGLLISRPDFLAISDRPATIEGARMLNTYLLDAGTTNERGEYVPGEDVLSGDINSPAWDALKEIRASSSEKATPTPGEQNNLSAKVGGTSTESTPTTTVEMSASSGRKWWRFW